MVSPSSRKALRVLLIGSIGASVIGCGGQGDPDSIVKGVKPVRLALVEPSDVKAQPADSPERAFLDMWSTLQYAAWDESLKFFDPELRSFIGPARLMEALKAQAQVFRTVRPSFVRVRRRGAEVTIHFKGKPENGNTTVGSVTMTRSRGLWRVKFLSLLDDGLRAHATQSVQAEFSPETSRISPRAQAAGFAASQIQSEFIARQLRRAGRTSPAGPTGR